MRKVTHLVALIALVLAIVPTCRADGPPLSPATKLFALQWSSSDPAAPELAEAYAKNGATAVVMKAVWAEIQPTDAPKLDFSSFDKQPLAESAKTPIVWIDLSGRDGRGTVGEFATQLARHANGMGIRHFAYTIREVPSGSSSGLTAESIEPLKRIYSAVKAVSKDNIVIVEQLRGYDAADAIVYLYEAGAKGSFDVAMVPVAKGREPTVDPLGLVAAHQEMARNGDAGKKLLVRGGWPPVTVTGRVLGDVRFRIETDLRNILTKRDIYDPEWVLGEVFPILETRSVDVVADFPPKLPETKLEAQLTSENRVVGCLTEQPCKLALTITNLGKDEMKMDRCSIALGGDTNLRAAYMHEGEAPKSVPSGGTATANFSVTLSDNAGGKQVTLIVGVDYSAGGKKYTADTWLTLVAKPQYEITPFPTRLILIPGEDAKRVRMTVSNHTDSAFDGEISLSASQEITAAPTEFAAKIGRHDRQAFVYRVSADKDTSPGHYAVSVYVGGKFRDWQAVDVGFTAKKTRDIALDGKLDDWRDEDAVRMGKRGRAWVGYSDSSLYVAVEVEAAKHVRAPAEANLSMGDSLVIGIDPLMNGARTPLGGYKEDDYEFTAADLASGALIAGTQKSALRASGPAAARLMAFSDKGGKSVYEVAIPWEKIAPLKPVKGTMFRIDLAASSCGNELRVVEWGNGLSVSADPRGFVPVVLAE